MREAVGGSLLFYLVVFFASVVILFFVGIIAYSKAYKVKNKIIEVIEREGSFYRTDVDGTNAIQKEINQELGRIGYRVTASAVSATRCQNDSSRNTCTNLNTSTYQYCVCMHDDAAENGNVYEVITYVHFDFPIIGDLISMPVKGETKVLNKKYDY